MVKYLWYEDCPELNLRSVNIQIKRQERIIIQLSTFAFPVAFFVINKLGAS